MTRFVASIILVVLIGFVPAQADNHENQEERMTAETHPFVPPTDEERALAEKALQWWGKMAAAALAGLAANPNLNLSDSDLALRAAQIADLMMQHTADREVHWMRGE